MAKISGPAGLASAPASAAVHYNHKQNELSE